jgi:acyl carrier protein
MDKSEIHTIVKKHLHRAAPEADLDQVSQDEDLGPALDIDSMDFYTMMVALSEELNIEIPEEEYGSLRSMESIEAFIQEAVNR